MVPFSPCYPAPPITMAASWSRNRTIVGCPSWAPPSKGSVPTWLSPSPRQVGHRRGRPEQSPSAALPRVLFSASCLVWEAGAVHRNPPRSVLPDGAHNCAGGQVPAKSYPDLRVPVGRPGRPIRSGGGFHPCLGPRPPYFSSFVFWSGGTAGLAPVVESDHCSQRRGRSPLLATVPLLNTRDCRTSANSQVSAGHTQDPFPVNLIYA